MELPYELSQEDPASDAGTVQALQSCCAYIVTACDEFYAMCQSMLAYGRLRLQRVASAAEAADLFNCARGVLLLDHRLQPPRSDSPDLKVSLPRALKRILVSGGISPQSLQSVAVLGYPLSRHKLLSTVFSLLNVRMPAYLFRQFDEEVIQDVDLSGLRVLVAEDNTINQKVARMTIERFGATVDMAANGIEALELVERFEYDLILMDIRMPVMDGVQSCKEIRSRG